MGPKIGSQNLTKSLNIFQMRCLLQEQKGCQPSAHENIYTLALFGSCLSLLKDKMFCQLLQWPFMSSWIVKSCSLLFCWTPLWRSLMGNLMLGFTIWEVNWETTMSHLSLPSFSLVQCTVQSVYRFSLSLWSATAISDVARACRSKKKAQAKEGETGKRGRRGLGCCAWALTPLIF